MNRRWGIVGNGACPTTEGACYVSFYDQATPEPTYLVLDTDYVNYALVYSCNEDLEFAYLYFLCRDAVCPDEWINKMYEVAEAALPNYDFDNLVPTVQGDMCTYDTSPK